MMRTTPSRMETIWKSRDIPTAAPVSCIDPRKPITVIFAEFASTSTSFLYSLILVMTIIAVLSGIFGWIFANS